MSGCMDTGCYSNTLFLNFISTIFAKEIQKFYQTRSLPAQKMPIAFGANGIMNESLWLFIFLAFR